LKLSGAKGVVERNFDDYEPARMRELPEVEVHIVGSQESPSGIGEPGVRSWRRPFATPSSRPRESSLPMELEVLA
jgi:isoquinoline 1-oxidoreductase subunit beta